jgi:hypothetical protein
MNKAKTKSKTSGKEFLQSAFEAEQEVLKVKLKLSSESITHSGVMGDVDEQHFIDFLKQHLPKRYAVDSAIVIDSHGKTSDQIDIVVFDNQYTPTLLDQKNHRFVPAEAVYAVFEVKPTIHKPYLEYAASKAKSVRLLQRTSAPIKHAGGTYKARDPKPIIAGIIAADVKWATGFNSGAFQKALRNYPADSKLDCGLSLSGASFDSFNGKLHVGPNSNSLAYFLFRLLGKLQEMGTVSAADWNEYAATLYEQDS